MNPVDVDVENHHRNGSGNNLSQKLYLRRQGYHIIRNAHNDKERGPQHNAHHFIGKPDGSHGGYHKARINGKDSQPRNQSMMHLAGIGLVHGADTDSQVFHHRRQYKGDYQGRQERERIGEQRNTS